jgi:hypothetical protein
MSKRTESNQGALERAVEAFSDHVLRESSEGRWRLHRHRDGKWCGAYAAEVIATSWCGHLIVVGDINTVVFGKHWPEKGDGLVPDIVSWIGETKDLEYVAEKARIGLGDERICEDWSWDDAVEDVREFAACEDDEWTRVLVDVIEHHEDEARDSQHAFIDCVYDVARSRNYDGDYDGLSAIGTRISTRVIYAYAAVRRVCELLREGAS